MIEIKFVGSGGQGAVVAARVLGVTVSKNGYQTQSFASYGYARRGGTVESYVRISEQEIQIHTKMYEPDYLVLMDEGFAKDPNVVSGLKKGGSILINSARSPEDYSSLGPFKILTVDANQIALDKDLRLTSGMPVINTSMVGAVLRMLSLGGTENLTEALEEAGIPHPERNSEAAKAAYERVILPGGATAAVPEEAEGASQEYEEPFPEYQSKMPPCEARCPAGEPIAESSWQIKNGEFERALEAIKAENPFPGICGRVCSHPCGPDCHRTGFDEGLAINALERAAFDYSDIKKVRNPDKKTETGKRVAVVGSGPAGMTCAYFLALLGHYVTVFEALPVLGGIPRVGIPAYRLPKGVVDREMNEIIDLGIEARTETVVGKDIPFGEILEKYDACFVATGTHRPVRLDIPGEDRDGVLYGLNFLKDIAFGREVDIGARVAVVGGGNTAVDAARTAKRLGAKEVTIIYRRSIEEMPAYRAEVAAAEEEGVRILYCAMPVRIDGNGSRVEKVECLKTRLVKEGDDGRLEPKPVEGSNVMVEADTVIVAVGESAEAAFLPGDIEMDKGLVRVDHLGRTSKAGVYAGGDLTTFSRSVVESVASGKRAALGMDSSLKEMDQRLVETLVKRESGAVAMRAYMAREYVRPDSEVLSFNDLNLSYFSKSARTREAELPVERRSSTFEEIHLGITREEAMSESERCFHCGRCNQCGNCYSFCPDVAVAFDAETFSFLVLREACKRCGICIEECPRSAIGWKGGSP